MFRHRNLLFTLVVVLSTMMATACGSAASPTLVEEPAQAPATEAPTEAAATEEAPATGSCIRAGHYAYLHCQSELGFRFRDGTGEKVRGRNRGSR